MLLFKKYNPVVFVRNPEKLQDTKSCPVGENIFTSALWRRCWKHLMKMAMMSGIIKDLGISLGNVRIHCEMRQLHRVGVNRTP